MGISYDTVVGKCPHCGADFSAQTKWLGCGYQTYLVGDVIYALGPFGAQRLELDEEWNKCRACGGLAAAVLEPEMRPVLVLKRLEKL